MDSIEGLFGGGSQAGYGDFANQIQQAMAAQKGLEGGAEQRINPYEQAGQQALGQEQSFLGGMADPQAFYDKIMGGYSQSPAAKFAIEQGTQASQNAAAQSGMQGSGAQVKALQQFGQKVGSQDMQNYLNQILGIGKTYLGGLGGLAGMGLRGAEDIGGYKMGLGRQLGEDYGGLGQAAMGQAQAKGDDMSNYGILAGMF